MIVQTVLLALLGVAAAQYYGSNPTPTPAPLATTTQNSCSVEYCANPNENTNGALEDIIHLDYANYMAWGDDNVTVLINGNRSSGVDPKDYLTMSQMYEAHGRFEGLQYGQNSTTLANCLATIQLAATLTGYLYARRDDKIMVPCGQYSTTDHDLAKCSIKRVGYGLSSLDRTGGAHLNDTNPGFYTKLAIDTHNALAAATNVANNNITGQACLDTANVVGADFLRIGMVVYSQQYIKNSYALVYQGKFD